MKSIITISLLMFGFLTLSAQNEKDLDALLRDNKEVPKVLLVGTFHFGYPGLDSHKTADAYKVDINSPKRQKEVEALVDYIAKYKPTKILVEAGANTGYLMHKFRDWKLGKQELRKREVDQIGFRLLDRFQLDTLYGIDAWSLSRNLMTSSDSTFAKPIMDRIYQEYPDSLYDSKFSEKYWEWYDLQDKRCVDMELLPFFQETNSQYHINRMHGHYILSDKTTNYNSMDGLAINWYSRNLRIFKNIQMIETDDTDRIMILIGSGHVPILQQQFICSPEYELINFNDL